MPLDSDLDLLHGEGLFLSGEPELDFLLLARSLLGDVLFLIEEPELDLLRLGGFLAGDSELDFLSLFGDLLGDGRFLTCDPELDLLRLIGDILGDARRLAGDFDLDLLGDVCLTAGFLFVGEPDSDLDLSRLVLCFLSLLWSCAGLSDELDLSLCFLTTLFRKVLGWGETDCFPCLLFLGSDSTENDL